MFEITYFRTTIVSGFNTINELPRFVEPYGRKILLLTGRRFARTSGYLDRINKILVEKGFEVYVYEGVEPNPPIKLCEDIASKFRGKNIDAIVAFGGGSVIDCAKAVATLLTIDKPLTELLYPRTVDRDVLPIIAIPTTCGTGSEVTRYAILTDVERRKKVPLVGQGIIPKVAVLDHNVLAHLPRDLVVWTALDALSHALEALISRNRSTFSDLMAYEATTRILYNIDRGASHYPEALKELHIASTMAGLAINTTGTVLLHAMGYYLTTHRGLHHGLANAVIMPYVMEFLLYGLPRGRLELILDLFNVNDVEGFLKRLSMMLLSLGIPRSMKEIGLDVNVIDEWIENTLQYRRNLENTPINVDKDVLKNIITKSFEGFDIYLKNE